MRGESVAWTIVVWVICCAEDAGGSCGTFSRPETCTGMVYFGGEAELASLVMVPFCSVVFCLTDFIFSVYFGSKLSIVSKDQKKCQIRNY